MWLDHDATFRKYKYLTIANIEKVDAQDAGGLEDKMSELKAFFSSQNQALVVQEMELKEIKSQLKDIAISQSILKDGMQQK